MTSHPFTYKTKQDVLDAAANIIKEHFHREGGAYTSATEAQRYLMAKLSCRDQEVFALLLLDSQHRLIAYKELFFGTIDSASVYPREIVKVALSYNAAAVILSHNHPSGITLPSQADIQITEQIKKALALVDVRTLDHIIVGEDSYSLAGNGYL
ncbi:RadC family protein [Marinomonas sp. ef1]|uniref:RadC family protein n=1 Tax=Marinomonas sp. ef1 TaxID=2005043 RepID=UPI000C28B438|nr:DNA repair protein RadC [Marinomonas sp. ef1]